MTYDIPCLNCKHLILAEKGKDWTCKAFGIIPNKILSRDIIHDKNIEGDNGLKYTPKSARITR